MCQGLNRVPSNRSAEVLTLSTSEWDLMWQFVTVDVISSGKRKGGKGP